MVLPYSAVATEGATHSGHSSVLWPPFWAPFLPAYSVLVTGSSLLFLGHSQHMPPQSPRTCYFDLDRHWLSDLLLWFLLKCHLSVGNFPDYPKLQAFYPPILYSSSLHFFPPKHLYMDFIYIFTILLLIAYFLLLKYEVRNICLYIPVSRLPRNVPCM